MSKWITLRIELNTATADDVVDEVNSAILCKLEEDKKISFWEWSELGGIMNTCVKCLNNFEEDDILWATPTGDLEGDTRPYCVACAPAEPNYGKEGE